MKSRKRDWKRDEDSEENKKVPSYKLSEKDFYPEIMFRPFGAPLQKFVTIPGLSPGVIHICPLQEKRKQVCAEPKSLFSISDHHNTFRNRKLELC